MSANAYARLLIRCADQPGLVAAATGFLYQHGANITELDQHSTDPSGGLFFMRLEFQTPKSGLSREMLEQAFREAVGQRFDMHWHISYAADRPRMAVLVSAHDHAAMELLWRWQRSELRVDIPCVISNHATLRGAVEAFGVPFHHVPQDDAGQRAAAEAQMLEILGEGVDFLVLARYMRILGPGFVARYPNRIINIHHSFLPAFVGADPYRQAYERGVKVVGVTAHFVTPNLDEGPIITQEALIVRSDEPLASIVRRGQALETKCVLRAVRAYVTKRLDVHWGRVYS